MNSLINVEVLENKMVQITVYDLSFRIVYRGYMTLEEYGLLLASKVDYCAIKSETICEGAKL